MILSAIIPPVDSHGGTPFLVEVLSEVDDGTLPSQWATLGIVLEQAGDILKVCCLAMVDVTVLVAGVRAGDFMDDEGTPD